MYSSCGNGWLGLEDVAITDNISRMGEIRNPMMQWILIPVTCGLYAYYYIFITGNELKTYLGREEINPVMDIVISFATCGLYGYFVMMKYAKYTQEAQQKAGVPVQEDYSTKVLLFCLFMWFGVTILQENLNKVWEANGVTAA